MSSLVYRVATYKLINHKLINPNRGILLNFVVKYSDMLPLILVTIVLVLIAFALFSVRLLFVKNGQFRGTCAGNSPFMQKEGVACGVCGRKPGEACGKEVDGGL